MAECHNCTKQPNNDSICRPCLGLDPIRPIIYRCSVCGSTFKLSSNNCKSRLEPHDEEGDHYILDITCPCCGVKTTWEG